MKTEGRVMLVNDLRSNEQKRADDLYVLRHENQDMRVVKLTVDGSASKYLWLYVKPRILQITMTSTSKRRPSRTIIGSTTGKAWSIATS